MRFVSDFEPATPVSDVMTKMPLITGRVGIDPDEALAIFAQHKVEKLPLVDGDGHLTGLITVKDFDKSEQYPNATKDAEGRLRVGAAIGFFGDAWERAEALRDAGVDVLVVDTANGESAGVLDIVRRLKADPTFAHIDVIGGNVATREGAQALIDAGADAVKVGVGPGSICTTRVVAGVGVPAGHRVYEASEAARGRGVPSSPTAACSTRATSRRRSSPVPTPSCSARCSPAPTRARRARLPGGKQFKPYRGMGSLGALQTRGKKTSYSKDRYFQADVPSDDKLIPEGIEGQVAVPRSGLGRGVPARRRPAPVDVLRRRPHDRRAEGQGQVRAHHAGGAQGVAPARRADRRRGAELHALRVATAPRRRLTTPLGRRTERRRAFALGGRQRRAGLPRQRSRRRSVERRLADRSDDHIASGVPAPPPRSDRQASTSPPRPAPRVCTRS